MSRVLKYSGTFDTEDKVNIPDIKKENIINDEFELSEPAPLEEVSPLELSQIEADKLIEETNIYCEAMINQAKQEYDNLCSSAMKKGYDDAFNALSSSVTECLNNISQVMSNVNKSHESYMAEYTQKLPSFALEIASAVMKTKLEEDPLIMCDLVEAVMSNIRESNWVLITLSKELVPLIELLQSELPAKCPTIGNIEVRGADIAIGNCTVDSIGGIVDASIWEQIENLKKRFELISQKRG